MCRLVKLVQEPVHASKTKCTARFAGRILLRKFLKLDLVGPKFMCL